MNSRNKKLLIFMFITLLALLTTGCSGGGNSPVFSEKQAVVPETPSASDPKFAALIVTMRGTTEIGAVNVLGEYLWENSTGQEEINEMAYAQFAQKALGEAGFGNFKLFRVYGPVDENHPNGLNIVCTDEKYYVGWSGHGKIPVGPAFPLE